MEQTDEFVFGVDPLHMDALMLCADLAEIEIVEQLLLEALNRDLQDKGRKPLCADECDISIRYHIPLASFSGVALVEAGPKTEIVHAIEMKFYGAAGEAVKKLRAENPHPNPADWILRPLDQFIGDHKLTLSFFTEGLIAPSPPLPQTVRVASYSLN